MLAEGVLWAVVPVRGIADGKTRLSGILADDERQALVRRLLLVTFAALASSRHLAGWAVVSRDPAVLALAAAWGGIPVRERADTPLQPTQALNMAIETGRDVLAEHSARHMLILPSDLPFVTGEALDAVWRAHARGYDVTVVPARDGDGTNALVLSPPMALAPAFGPGSCAVHTTRALASGCAVQHHDSEELAFDLDTPVDLADMRARAGYHAAAAYLAGPSVGEPPHSRAAY